MLEKLAPCEANAAPILAKTRPHCASKSAGALPSLPAPELSMPTWPAMNRNSDALTRVICEYCPSGLPRLSGLRILMSGKVWDMDGSAAVCCGWDGNPLVIPAKAGIHNHGDDDLISDAGSMGSRFRGDDAAKHLRFSRAFPSPARAQGRTRAMAFSRSSGFAGFHYTRAAGRYDAASRRAALD